MNIPAGILRTPQGIYVLEKDSHLSRWIENHGRLDLADGQIAFFRQYIPPGGTVLDAGACIGDHTATYARLVGASGTVIACEPNPLAFECLKRNFEDDPRVRMLNFALSDALDQLSFHSEENAGASHVSDKGEIAVRCITIDSLSLTHLNLIHLDCEGFEPRVLKGAENTIRRLRPAIVLEINHACLARYGSSESAVLGILAELGYEHRELEPHLNSTYPQRDIIALPK